MRWISDQVVKENGVSKIYVKDSFTLMPSVAFNISFVKACSYVLHLATNKITVLRSTVLF